MLPPILEKVLERRQQEGPKPSALWVSFCEGTLFQESREKRLGDILGIFGTVVLPTNIRVQRIPIIAAQAFKSFSFLRGVNRSNPQDNTPMRCREPMSLMASQVRGCLTGDGRLAFRLGWVAIHLL